MASRVTPNLKLNRKVAIYAAVFAAFMLAMGFASVPLYRIFCQVTGFGGTTQRANAAEAAKVQVAARTISVRFDGNVENGMPWKFGPEQVTQDMRIGERKIAYFTAENTSDHPITGVASFNVEPDLAGLYFKKIQCFCFNQQTLQPHEKVRMPVLYYVDPAILKDPESAATTQITLSYTFHVSADQSAAKAAPVEPASKALDRAETAR
ncbi:MAG: cytochrome c oxidase assembly protein [Novosphingobium sp.]